MLRKTAKTLAIWKIYSFECSGCRFAVLYKDRLWDRCSCQ